MHTNTIYSIVKNFRKQSPSDQAVSQFYSRFFRPADRLLTKEVVGREAFREATGLDFKWLNQAEQWGIITPENRNGDAIYSSDDLASITRSSVYFSIIFIANLYRSPPGACLNPETFNQEK